MQQEGSAAIEHLMYAVQSAAMFVCCSVPVLGLIYGPCHLNEDGASFRLKNRLSPVTMKVAINLRHVGDNHAHHKSAAIGAQPSWNRLNGS